MTASQPIEVRDMHIVHEVFRSTYSESAGLVRSNPTPTPARVAFLADHVDFGVTMLHHHHEAEDDLLYPILIERAPEQATMTEEVEHQHREVTSALDAVSATCAAWRGAPSVESGEALAAALDDLNVMLQPHLDDEEREVVPLAAVTLTQKEWDDMGKRAQSTIPRDRMAVAFGMLLERLDEDDRTYMKSQLPFPVRLLYPVLIQRPWNKYADTLRNGT